MLLSSETVPGVQGINAWFREHRCDRFAAGNLLLHPRYDMGIIRSVEGEGLKRHILVEFETVGMKKLSVRWAAENCDVGLS